MKLFAYACLAGLLCGLVLGSLLFADYQFYRHGQPPASYIP